jgi:hypothetical protein
MGEKRFGARSPCRADEGVFLARPRLAGLLSQVSQYPKLLTVLYLRWKELVQSLAADHLPVSVQKAMTPPRYGVVAWKAGPQGLEPFVDLWMTDFSPDQNLNSRAKPSPPSSA